MLGCFETESSCFVEIAHRLSSFACVRLCGNLALAVFSDKLISITHRTTKEADNILLSIKSSKTFKGVNEWWNPFTLFSECIYDLIVTNGGKSSVIHLQKSSTIIEELRSTPIHDLSFIAFAMKLFDDAPTTIKIGASILVLITKKDAARKKQKEARIHMLGRQLADIAQHKCTCNPPCLEGNEYKAFMIKETENVGFEIVHPFSSQKMQEERIRVRKSKKIRVRKSIKQSPTKKTRSANKIGSIFIFQKKQNRKKKRTGPVPFQLCKDNRNFTFFQLFGCNNVCMIGKSLLYFASTTQPVHTRQQCSYMGAWASQAPDRDKRKGLS